MVFRVTLNDGSTMDVRVFRECTEDEARERVGHFYPFNTIETIDIIAGDGFDNQSSETESE